MIKTNSISSLSLPNLKRIREWVSERDNIEKNITSFGKDMIHLFCSLEEHGLIIRSLKMSSVNHFIDLFPQTLSVFFCNNKNDLLFYPKPYHFFIDIEIMGTFIFVTLHLPVNSAQEEKDGNGN
jgi:hypothetical protein